MTSIKGFSYFVATNAPLPVASFTQLTVQSFASWLSKVKCKCQGCMHGFGDHAIFLQSAVEVDVSQISYPIQCYCVLVVKGLGGMECPILM